MYSTLCYSSISPFTALLVVLNVCLCLGHNNANVYSKKPVIKHDSKHPTSIVSGTYLPTNQPREIGTEAIVLYGRHGSIPDDRCWWRIQRRVTPGVHTEIRQEDFRYIPTHLQHLDAAAAVSVHTHVLSTF